MGGHCTPAGAAESNRWGFWCDRLRSGFTLKMESSHFCFGKRERLRHFVMHCEILAFWWSRNLCMIAATIQPTARR
jgi:hypothetical protein